MRGFLWVKTMSTCWTSDDDATGVVTFLEASLLEIHLVGTMEGLLVALAYYNEVHLITIVGSLLISFSSISYV